MPIISKKNLIFLIFGTVKIKNPRAVGKNRRILDQNLVVKGEHLHILSNTMMVKFFYLLDINLDAILRWYQSLLELQQIL